MSAADLVRSIAARMPSDLAGLRAKLMLEPLCESLGVEEVPCPACGGGGWLDRAALEHCPLCGGFREVPDALAEWFRAELCRAAEVRRLPVPAASCAPDTSRR